jgi:hypothetical protein
MLDALFMDFGAKVYPSPLECEPGKEHDFSKQLITNP